MTRVKYTTDDRGRDVAVIKRSRRPDVVLVASGRGPKRLEDRVQAFLDLVD